jgi:peptidoglycan-associated lipoprotein
MKKYGSFFLSLLFVLAAVSMSGCKSLGRNPAGVYGAGGSLDSIPLSDRFQGGTEHPGLFPPVYFAYDSSQVVESERSKVEAVSHHLKQNSSVAVIIEGHCDERGSREYNLALGERRALAVRAYLAGLGIGADRVQTKSYGEENPAAPGHDEESWARNRRGEFVLYY